jgi:integrase
MASIERRVRDGQVRWLVRYRDPAGRQRARTFRRKADAQGWLVENQLDLIRGRWRDPKRAQVRLAAWVEAWEATTVDLRPSTRARDETYVRAYVLPRFGGWPLGSIGQSDVRAWVAELAGQGLAPATVTKAYQLLGKILGAAVDAGILVESPCRRMPLPRVEREAPRFLTAAEVARLARSIDPRYRALVFLGAYGGLRAGELAGLRRAHVAMGAAAVEVVEVLGEVRGRLVEGPPKTRAGRRTVTLPAGVAAELAAHLAEHVGAAPDARVFTAPEGGPLRLAAFRSRTWRPAVERAGLAPLRVHDLRHTAVALWVAAGASPKEVAARAGHASVRTVLDVYGGLYPEQDQALVARLDELHAAGQAGAAGGEVVPIEWGRRR